MLVWPAAVMSLAASLPPESIGSQDTSQMVRSGVSVRFYISNRYLHRHGNFEESLTPRAKAISKKEIVPRHHCLLLTKQHI